MKCETRSVVRTRQQTNTIFVQHPQSINHLCESRAVRVVLGCVLDGNKCTPAITLIRNRHVIEIVDVARLNGAGPAQHQPFNNHRRGIVSDMFRLHQRDRVLHRRRGKVQVSGACHRGETQGSTSIFFGPEQPAEHQLIDVSDFVVAIVNCPIGSIKSRDVPGHRHAQMVRFVRYGLDPIGIHRVVDLDLEISAIGVPAHVAQSVGE